MSAARTKRGREPLYQSLEEEDDEESCTLVSSQQRIEIQLQWLTAAAEKRKSSARKDDFLHRLRELQKRIEKPSL